VRKIVRDIIKKLWGGNVKSNKSAPAGKRADVTEESLAATEGAGHVESTEAGAVNEDMATEEVGVRRPLEEEPVTNGAIESLETAPPL
jgi:hypothetical protein